MSFDLALINGDLKIISDGSIKTVQDTDKLRQDILKILITLLGSNRFHPWYGCVLSDNIIGKNLPDNIILNDIRTSIFQSLDKLKKLQQQQQTTQKVSLAELINSIGNIDVYRDPSDPRQIKIRVEVYSRRLTKIEEIFSLEL
jgi:hypothetical protein